MRLSRKTLREIRSPAIGARYKQRDRDADAPARCGCSAGGN